ncbi:MAG: C39 family peptidase [Oscillospiraceae bacterium]|nr:C39 family peptidase [Oscillospiraceae bacterium]
MAVQNIKESSLILSEIMDYRNEDFKRSMGNKCCKASCRIAIRAAFSLIIAFAVALTLLFMGIGVYAADEGKDNSSESVKTSEQSGGIASFTVSVFPCSGENTSDGKIKVAVENGSDNDVYYLSTNGGESYLKMKGRTATVVNLKKGSYSICIMRNKDKTTLSQTHTVYVGVDGEEISTEISADSSPVSIYKDGKIKVHIENYDKQKKYEASVDSGKSWTAMKSDTIYFNSLKEGKYTVLVRESDKKQNISSGLTVTIAGASYSKKGYIGANAILQNPELPTGCEITSLTMLLNYLGFDVDKLTMADKYLPKGEYRNSDFNEVFVGTPKSTFAYGCFSNAIVTAAKSYLEDSGGDEAYKVRNISGCPTKALYAAVDNGNPVIVWASIDMKAIKEGATWTVSSTGKTLTWPANEHCMLLVGYNTEKGVVYVNDPLKGLTSYDMEIFETRFESLSNQAVIITER